MKYVLVSSDLRLSITLHLCWIHRTRTPFSLYFPFAAGQEFPPSADVGHDPNDRLTMTSFKPSSAWGDNCFVTGLFLPFNGWDEGER